MLDRRLIRAINTGRCLVLVGSGLSCEIGYPSWHQLAEKSYEKIRDSKILIDDESYRKYLDDTKYPDLFRQIERDLGDDRQALIDIITPLLLPQEKKRGMLYELIARWPFACYLTTNYDDEISIALEEVGEHFAAIQNKPHDFLFWRDGVSHNNTKVAFRPNFS